MSNSIRSLRDYSLEINRKLTLGKKAASLQDMESCKINLTSSSISYTICSQIRQVLIKCHALYTTYPFRFRLLISNHTYTYIIYISLLLYTAVLFGKVLLVCKWRLFYTTALNFLDILFAYHLMHVLDLAYGICYSCE